MENMTKEQINNIRIKKISEFRRSQGLSQKNFAQAIGMNASYYSRLENNLTPISEKALRKIAETYNLPLDIVLDDRIEKIEEEDLDKDIFSNSSMPSIAQDAHKILDELLLREGKNNLSHMKAIVQFLYEVKYFLEFKFQLFSTYKDPEEGDVEARLREESESLLEMLFDTRM